MTTKKPLAVEVVATGSPSGIRLTGNAPEQLLQWTPSAKGLHGITLRVRDAHGRTQTQSFLLGVSDDRQLPANPADQATAIAPHVLTPFGDSTKFLYENDEPIQKGVAAGTIDPVHAAVLRGRVLNKSGAPLAGVTVRVQGRPEFGQTQTRADGWFDMAVNGGAWLTVHYEKTGYLAAQRKVLAPLRDWAIADETVLIPFDAQYSQIDLTRNQLQAYWGSEQVDDRGTRRTTIIFPTGTQATAEMPDGSTQPLDYLTVRVSEYTVGDNGPQTMPGELPITVGYTWAANFSADEAEALGARHVRFDRPVYTYTTNFIEAPVGTAVPAGWYDFERTVWIGSDNGRVVEILSIASGEAVMRVTEDNRPATTEELAELGITTEELQTLAQMYPEGTQLWRVPIEHFTPWDYNWPWGPPEDADPPPADDPDTDNPPIPETPPDPNDPDHNDPSLDEPGEDVECGCDIYVKQQAVGQGIALQGTPFSLYYRSDKKPSAGVAVVERSKWKTRVKAQNATAHPKLRDAEVRYVVAGRYIAKRWGRSEFSSIPSLDEGSWDGTDVYGRPVHSGTYLHATVVYAYHGVYYSSQASFRRAFERLSGQGAGISSSALRVNPIIYLTRTHPRRWLKAPAVRSFDVLHSNVGGWALKGMRLYDADKKVLYNAGAEPLFSWAMARGLTSKHTLQFPPSSTLLKNGKLAIPSDHQVLLYPDIDALPEGEFVLAGQGTAGFSGDGGPAQAAQFRDPTLVAEAPNGGFYIMDDGNRRLRYISPDGNVDTVAGNGQWNNSIASGKSVNAKETGFIANSMAVMPDGNLLAVSDSSQLVQLTSSGLLTAIPLPDTSARPYIIIPSRAGGAWVGARQSEGGGTALKLYRLTDTGQFQTIEFDADISGATTDTDGSLLVAVGVKPELQAISPFGNGTKTLGSIPLEGRTPLQLLGRNSDGELLIRTSTGFLYQHASGLPSFKNAQTHIVGRSDGTTYDEFAIQGMSLALRSAFTGEALARYQYNSDTHLISVTDAFGNVAHFQRDAQNRLTKVTGFDGQITELTYSGNGYLESVTEPGGGTHHMVYDARGLLTQYQDQRGGTDRFSYDDKGKLVHNRAADGSGWTLGRNSADNTVTATTAEGRSKSVQQLSSYSRLEKTSIGFDGLASEKSGNRYYGSSTTSYANGTQRSLQRSNHGVFGAVAPEISITQRNDTGSTGYVALSQRESGSSSWDTDRFSHWSSKFEDNGALWTQAFHTAFGPTMDARDPYGAVTSTNYNEWMQPTLVTTPSQAQISYAYNARGQVSDIELKSRSGESRNFAFSYHPKGATGAGKMAAVTNPLGQENSFEYDAAGNLIRNTLPDGRSTIYTFDAGGNMLSLKTPSGIQHSFTYNGVNKPSSYVAPQGSTEWVYNRERQPVQITRPGENAVLMSYDAGARLSTIQSNAGTTTRHYDDFGQLQSIAGAGQQLTYSRTHSVITGETWSGDIQASLNTSINTKARPTRQRIASGADSVDIPVQMDIAGRRIQAGNTQLTYSKDGLLQSAVSDDGSVLYAYNGFNEVTDTKFVTSNTATNPDAYPTKLQLRSVIWALGDALKAQIIEADTCRPRGWYVYLSEAEIPRWEWRYDTPALHEGYREEYLERYGEPQLADAEFCLNIVAYEISDIALYINSNPDDTYWWTPNVSRRLKALRNATANGAPAVAALDDYYGVAETLTDTTSFNTDAVSHLYNQVERLIADLETSNYRFQLPADFHYERDQLGRITRQTARLFASTKEHAYEYDQAGRLAKHTQDGHTTTWTYDPNGNRTHENDVLIASYDNEDRLLNWKGNTYQFTAAGDLQQKTTPSGTTSYQYDSLGNLRQVRLPDGTQIEYIIDPTNRRIGKKKNGVLQYGLIYQDTLRPIAEIKPGGGIRSVFIYADKSNVPTMMQRDGKHYRIISDHLGSVRMVLDVQTNAIMQQLDYDAWGRVIADSNPGYQPFGFAGGLYDPETGLTRFGARDYDGETGKWTAKDPILFDGRDTNLFGYVGGDPVNAVDPHGKFAIFLPLIPIVITGGDIAIGAGIAVLGYGLDLIFNREKDVPNEGPPNEWIDGNNRSRLYGPDGKPVLDIDKPHQGYDRPHVHEWPNGRREHPGRDFCPLP